MLQWTYIISIFQLDDISESFRPKPHPPNGCRSSEPGSWPPSLVSADFWHSSWILKINGIALPARWPLRLHRCSGSPCCFSAYPFDAQSLGTGTNHPPTSYDNPHDPISQTIPQSLPTAAADSNGHFRLSLDKFPLAFFKFVACPKPGRAEVGVIQIQTPLKENRVRLQLKGCHSECTHVVEGFSPQMIQHKA